MERSRVRAIALGFLLSAAAALNAASPARPYTVENYDASIRADLAQQRLYGEVAIRFHGQGDIAVSALELDAGGLKITSVREGESPQSFEQNKRSLFVVLTHPVHPDEQRTIKVQYEAGPASGLRFFPIRSSPPMSVTGCLRATHPANARPCILLSPLRRI